jgi:hypothetical protein
LLQAVEYSLSSHSAYIFYRILSGSLGLVINGQRLPNSVPQTSSHTEPMLIYIYIQLDTVSLLSTFHEVLGLPQSLLQTVEVLPLPSKRFPVHY